MQIRNINLSLEVAHRTEKQKKQLEHIERL